MYQDDKNQQVQKQEDCHSYSMIEKTPKDAHMYDQLDIEPCKSSKKWCMLQFSRKHKVLIAAVIFIFTFISYTSVMTAMLYFKLESVKSLCEMNTNSSVTVRKCSCENGGTLSHLENTSISDLQLLIEDILILQNEELNRIKSTLSHLKSNSNSINNKTNDVRLLLNQIKDYQSEKLPWIGATLSHLKENSLHTSSTTNEILFFLQETLKLQNITAAIPDYRHMEKLCESEGPWTRVAFFEHA